MDATGAVGGCIPPSTGVPARKQVRLLQHQHPPARPGGREGFRPVARNLHRAEDPETRGHEPHGFPGGSRDPVAVCPRLLQDGGRQDRRRDRLESVMGLGVGQHDLDAQGPARVDARPRHRQAGLARHEARATTVLAGAPGRRRRAIRAGARKPERLDRPQRQHHELHGLPLLPAVRGDDDGGDAELGRRYPGLVDDDPGHHPGHQPQQRLARPAEGGEVGGRDSSRAYGSTPPGRSSRRQALEWLSGLSAEQRQALARQLAHQGERLRTAGSRPEAERTRNWAIELKPADWMLWVARGNIRAQLGQWGKAADDSSRAIELSPDEVSLRYWHALARLGAGDRAGYRRACGAMLRRFGPADEPEVAHWVAWTAALAPDAVNDWNRLLTTADVQTLAAGRRAG